MKTKVFLKAFLCSLFVTFFFVSGAKAYTFEKSILETQSTALLPSIKVKSIKYTSTQSGRYLEIWHHIKTTNDEKKTALDNDLDFDDEFSFEAEKNGAQVKRISVTNANKFLNATYVLKPKIVSPLFKVSRLGEMEPSFRAGIRGNGDLQHKEIISR